MVLSIVVFAVVTLGFKLALAAVVIYYLLPADRTCQACEGETVLLALPGALARPARLLRLQRRWCLRCGERSLARGGGEPGVPVGRAEASRVEHPG